MGTSVIVKSIVCKVTYHTININYIIVRAPVLSDVIINHKYFLIIFAFEFQSFKIIVVAECAILNGSLKSGRSGSASGANVQAALVSPKAAGLDHHILCIMQIEIGCALGRGKISPYVISVVI